MDMEMVSMEELLLMAPDLMGMASPLHILGIDSAPGFWLQIPKTERALL